MIGSVICLDKINKTYVQGKGVIVLGVDEGFEGEEPVPAFYVCLGG